LMISLIFYNCRNEPFVITKKIRDNRAVYVVEHNDGEQFEFALQSNGKLDYVSNKIYYDKIQTIYFHGNGLMESKIMKDTLHRTNGRAYYFYDISGNLSGDYNYVNNVKYGNAVTYYDSTAIQKKSMLFNEEGLVYWYQEYDRKGKVIKEEGHVSEN